MQTFNNTMQQKIYVWQEAIPKFSALSVFAAAKNSGLQAQFWQTQEDEVRLGLGKVAEWFGLDFAQVQAVIDLAMEKFGRIDVLYNNAGIMPTAPLVEGHRDEWQNMLDINIMGVLNGISAVLPIMEKQKSGHIISTDSVAGHVVYPDSAVYCGTKFAVRAIMEGLRQEQLQNNIKSTIISPGAVQTELYQTISDKKAALELHEAQKEWGLTSEDIASAVAFAIETPDRMSVSNMIIRPTTQEV